MTLAHEIAPSDPTITGDTSADTPPADPATPPPPPYLEIARLAAKGPFSSETRHMQQFCLAVLSIFFLTYSNLAAVEGTELAGIKFIVSVKVLTYLAFIFGAYTYIRFIGDAAIEGRLFDLEFLPRYDAAAERIAAERLAYREYRARAAAYIAEQEDHAKRNHAFKRNRDERIEEVSRKYIATLDSLEQHCMTLQREYDTTPETAQEDRQALLRQITDTRMQHLALSEERDAEIRHIAAEQYPYPAEISEHDLEHIRVFPWEESTRIIFALRLARARGRLVTWLDFILPSAMMIGATGCFLGLLLSAL